MKNYRQALIEKQGDVERVLNCIPADQRPDLLDTMNALLTYIEMYTNQRNDEWMPHRALMTMTNSVMTVYHGKVFNTISAITHLQHNTSNNVATGQMLYKPYYAIISEIMGSKASSDWHFIGQGELIGNS